MFFPLPFFSFFSFGGMGGCPTMMADDYEASWESARRGRVLDKKACKATAAVVVLGYMWQDRYN